MNQTELTGRLRDVLHKIAELENAGGLVTTHRLASELTQARQNIWMYVQKLQRAGPDHLQPHQVLHHPDPAERGRLAGVGRAARREG